MSGYDPMEELATDLEAATKPARSVTVSPPPRPAAIEVVTPRPVVSKVAEPAESPSVKVEHRPSASPRAARSTTPAPNALRTTSASLPTVIVERIQRLRLDHDVEGRRFNIASFFNGAVDRLPTTAIELERTLERYRDQLNINKRQGEDGWHPESRFAVRIGETQERTVAIAIRSLYERTGNRHFKQDLWALALLRELAEAPG